MTRKLALAFAVASMLICGMNAAGRGAFSAPDQVSSNPSALDSQVRLAIVSLTEDSSNGTVTFTLRNAGSKVITAWDVQIAAGSGPERRYGGYGMDAFREFAGLVEGHHYMRPGETVTATSRRPAESEHLSPVTVTGRTAIFDDASFAGDTRSAQLILEGRRAQLDAWHDIQQKLEKLRRDGAVDVDGLQAILTAVDSTSAGARGDIVRKIFRTNLSLRIADVRAGSRDAIGVLDELLTQAQREVAVAAAHSR